MTEINKQLHETLIEILDFVKEICEKHELTYFLIYGTALGAKRHCGFIPWDDDVDIALPREHYNILIDVLSKMEQSIFSLQNEDNEPNYFLPFAKLRKNNTIFIEKILDVEYENNGIYIDIFPLDFVENPDSFNFKMRKTMFNYIKHILKFSSCRSFYKNKYSSVRYLMENIMSIPTLFFSNRRLLFLANNLISSTNKANFIGQYDESSERAIMPSSYYFPSRSAVFEGKIYSVPAKLEDYLKYFYGSDYMELPPIEKRVTHQPIKLRFKK
ncbi:TPA: phosphorylcholine transferase LicD [Streptococcus pneumoniae]|uniref:LicD family protein n=1 Tax=Streptococcus pneumoniae TaxID=1313 RepID=UPI0005DE970D|nr:LicD family protein [Streptococcus pneumoniae]CIU97006.1 phosphorylcholine transferase LicD1 [Streptococcus pneumoniae]VPT02158.1 phosphorylcholine transferase LicD1 [Streptococcus pneumoniae]VSS23065.1 phosphorylcholine transferase LicD1 [Streptococcus pneumoniae]VTB77304.1 phosphorylcholine transferase LicD1 [Streptococcus pneumoniae]HEU4278628.1 LicD family protein [Streptococcus pneumoniae]